MTLTQQYNTGDPLSSQEINAALTSIQQQAGSNPTMTPSQMRAAAMAQAEFQDVQNFVSGLASLRQSIGQSQPLTPSLIIQMAKTASANGDPIPQQYITDAIGYLNGIATS